MSSFAQAMPPIESRILLVRGQKVLIDADLAQLYGVTTKALNQAVKRNSARFPGDFMFQLSEHEKMEVVTNCDHLKQLRFSKSCPYAFTEHGAIQAANVLASTLAIEMGLYVVRAFIHLREMATSYAELVSRLNDLEGRTALLALQQSALEKGTRAELEQIFATLRQLMSPPSAPKRRPIGFIVSDEP